MSALEWWTWVAIVVLVVGSIAVFFWFARDLIRMAREER
jgi:hypothetical protein